MASNGTSTSRFRHGIYAPTMTFFDKETEELDIPTIKKHAVRLAQAGLVGLVTMGSNGEAVHLTKEEKTAVTKATREALDEAGFKDVVVLQGCSEAGVRLTIDLCKAAASAGAEGALILPPAYYRAQVNETMMMDYYTAVAEGSPLPIVLYNYPGAVSGVDMDSDFMIRLVDATKGKVCGAKFTDANTGKLTRLAYKTDACSVKSNGSGWMAFGGIADFTLQTAISGGSGIIAGGANVMPKLCVKVCRLMPDKCDPTLTSLPGMATLPRRQIRRGGSTSKGPFKGRLGSDQGRYCRHQGGDRVGVRLWRLPTQTIAKINRGAEKEHQGRHQ